MKKILILFVLGASAVAASAAEPLIFASALSAEDAPTENAKIFNYTLNTPATAVQIILTDKDGKETAIDVPESGLAFGANTVTLELPETLATGDYTWAVKATADAVAEPTRVLSYGTTNNHGTKIDLNFTLARGLAINTNPASEQFGQVYMTNSWCTDYTKKYVGVIIYNPLFEFILPEAENQVSYLGGVNWRGTAAGKTNSSPNDAFLSEDGNLYLADWTDVNAGIYMMYGTNPNKDFLHVFGGTMASSGLHTCQGAQIGGSCSTACTLGSGENLVLYTFDEELGGLAKYDLGNSDSPWLTAPTEKFGSTFTIGGTSYSVNSAGNGRLRPDGRGGFWMFINNTGAADNPTAIHFNSNDEADYQFSGIRNTLSGAFGLSADGTLMCIADGQSIKFYDVAFDETGVPSLSEHNFADGTNSVAHNAASIYGLKFDYAGNLHVLSLGTGLGLYAMPKADNSAITPAAGQIHLDITSGVESAVLSPAIEYKGGIISAAEGAEVFNALGAKVAEGAEISTAGLAAGVYIVRSGKQTLKIIR